MFKGLEKLSQQIEKDEDILISIRRLILRKILARILWKVELNPICLIKHLLFDFMT